jgi:hypothetical protein
VFFFILIYLFPLQNNKKGILLVPIGAAVIVASTLAFLIFAYAQPASPEEDPDDPFSNDEKDF